MNVNIPPHPTPPQPMFAQVPMGSLMWPWASTWMVAVGSCTKLATGDWTKSGCKEHPSVVHWHDVSEPSYTNVQYVGAHKHIFFKKKTSTIYITIVVLHPLSPISVPCVMRSSPHVHKPPMESSRHPSSCCLPSVGSVGCNFQQSANGKSDHRKT